MFLVSNVLDEESLSGNLDEILSRYGCIDVLLNAAGGNMDAANVSPDKTVFDLDIEAMRKVCDLNIFGTVIPTKVFLKPMVEKGSGVIVNFCSMTSFRPLTRVAGYGIAKAGIARWTEWLAGELATKFGNGFRVNAIAPGFILSEQNRSQSSPTHLSGVSSSRRSSSARSTTSFLMPQRASPERSASLTAASTVFRYRI